MALNNIHIKNFQSHRDSTLELSPGVTAIVGPNNQGKSAVIRALKKVLRDVPLGSSFITDGEKESVVKVGGVVRKVRNDSSSKSNMYIIDGVEYAKFGKGVSEDVLKALGVSPVQTFGDVELDLNFYSTIDGFFLMTGTGLPSLRGKVLGKITGVDIAQRVIQLATATENNLSRKKKSIEKDIEDTNNKLGRYVGLDSVVNEMDVIYKDISEATKIEKEIDTFQDIHKKIKRCVRGYKQYKAAIKVLSKNDATDDLQQVQDLNELIEAIETTIDLQEHIQLLKNVLSVDIDISTEMRDAENIDEIIGVCESTMDIDNYIRVLQKVLQVDIPDFEEVFELNAQIEDTEDAYVTAMALGTDVDYKTAELVDVRERLTKVEYDITKLQEELGTCPLCGSDFN